MGASSVACNDCVCKTFVEDIVIWFHIGVKIITDERTDECQTDAAQAEANGCSGHLSFAHHPGSDAIFCEDVFSNTAKALSRMEKYKFHHFRSHLCRRVIERLRAGR